MLELIQWLFCVIAVEVLAPVAVVDDTADDIVPRVHLHSRNNLRECVIRLVGFGYCSASSIRTVRAVAAVAVNSHVYREWE